MAKLNCAQCGEEIRTMGSSESHIPAKNEHPLFSINRTTSTGNVTSDYCCSKTCLENYLNEDKHHDSGDSRSYDSSEL